MRLVVLTATAKAGSRTKNRLREHPGAFTLTRTEHCSPAMGGRLSHHLVHSDGWSGWLAADEVTIRNL